MNAKTTPLELIKFPKNGSTFLIQKRIVESDDKKSERILISFDLKPSCQRNISIAKLKEIGEHLIEQARIFEEQKLCL